jgi:dipeptidase E
MDGFFKDRHLGYAIPILKKFFTPFNTKEILVIPYAYPDIRDGVNTKEFSNLFEHVRSTFKILNINVITFNTQSSSEEQQEIIKRAEAIYITGGNTFNLLTNLYEKKLLGIIREKINSGTPFIGVSAGSVIHSPTIKTTNDMPIIYPPSLESIGTLPFQINSHYNNFMTIGFQGETRDNRIKEYLQFNRKIYNGSSQNFVIGLKEGSVLHISGNSAEISGFGTRSAEKISIDENNNLVKLNIPVGSRIDNLIYKSV